MWILILDYFFMDVFLMSKIIISTFNLCLGISIFNLYVKETLQDRNVCIIECICLYKKVLFLEIIV